MSSLLPARYRVDTDPLQTERRLELGLVLLAGVLLLQLGWGGYRLATIEHPEAVVPAADSLQVRELLQVAQVGEEQRTELRDRPLFWASRRPQAAAEPTDESDAKKAGEIAGLRLVGVFGSGDSAGIIVTLKDKGRKRLQIGDKVNGWKLRSVEGGQAVLSAGGRNKTLSLTVNSGAAKRPNKKPRSARAR